MNVLDFLSIVLLAAIPFDLYCAVRIIRSAVQRPHIQALTAMAFMTLDILFIASVTGLLAINRLAFTATGKPAFPTDISGLLLVAALLGASLPNIYLVRLLRQWDNGSVPHRRHDDPPEGTA